VIADINHISWEGTFRIWFEEHCTGIWWEGLPADVHFTLSHRPQDNYVNLHVTRNYGDPRNKPKIEIARLNKEACKTMLESFDAVFHKNAWTKLKLNFSKIRNKKSSAHYFLLLDELQKHKQFSKFRNSMSLAFLKSSKIKQKRRLKILKTIEQEVEQLILDPSLQKTFYKSLRKLPLCWTNKPQAAILVSKDYTGCVVITKDGVFELNRSALPEILSRLIQPDLYADLNSFIPLAIQQVSIANTYQDTEHLDIPFLLHLVEPKI
jgi:hypothetical protein